MTKDLLHSIRSLLRHPAFTAVAVITLMLAIGVNTTIFSVVNAVLLKALPFRDPQRLVSVNSVHDEGGLPGIAAYQYLAWKDRNTTFDDLAAFTDNNFNLTGNGEPERISCAQVTSSLFTTLGVKPVRGRFFLAEEDKPGAAKNQPVYDVKTLAQRVDEAVAISRSLMVLFASFALLALILGAVGIYGIVSYSVTQRTHEIGIRMALGARAGNVLSLIMKNGLTLVLAGIVIGVGSAFGLTQFLATLLFGIEPTDRVTFVVVSATFFVIAMLAALVPAIRATRVDPLVALRDE